MNYDWEKIFKSKSDKELFKIFTGQSLLNSEAKKIAEIELKNRGFDFENIEKYRKKWKLKSLIDEEQYERKQAKLFLQNPLTDLHLFMAIFGLIIIVSSIISYLKNNVSSDFLLSILVGITMIIVGFFGYKRKKKREKYRKTKIEQLRDELY